MKTLEYHLDHLEASKAKFVERTEAIIKETDPDRKELLVDSAKFHGNQIKEHALEVVRLTALQY